MTETRQRRSPVVIALSFALALSLTFAIWQSARNGLSDLYARPAIDYLESKRFENYTVDRSDWQVIEDNVLYASTLMPGNPDYLEALGHLQQIKLSQFANELSDLEIDARALAARNYYREAIINRPTWPYYWGNLALEHYRRGNFAADDYSDALANTSRFGPWKNDAQRLVLDLGSETWDVLSPRARYEFILNLERSLHRQPENTLQIMDTFDRWGQICDLSVEIPNISLPHLNSLCTASESTALPDHQIREM